MKYTTTLFFLLLPFLAFSQSNSSVDFIGGIDYTYRTLNTSSDESVYQTIINSRDNEKGNINWRVGFNYNRRLNHKLFIKTGLRLMSLGYHTTSNFGDLRWGTQHDGNGGFDPTINPGEPDLGDLKISNNYWFIELPIALRYEFFNNKFTPYAEIGIAPAYYLLNRHVATNDGDRELTVTKGKDTGADVNRVQIESIIAFGFNYNIKESLQLFGQPTFRYHLTKMWDTDLKERLWSAGLEFGIRKGLN